MKLPSRPATHLTEAASWRLLQSLAPETWIVREVTERDYGIDAYIEMTSADGEITGDLISVQLKGTAALEWKAAKKEISAKPKAVRVLDDGDHTARSPSIATSTASLQDLYKADRAQFRDEYCWLHELTLDRALVQIEAIFPTLLRAAVDLIESVEGDYWRAHHPVLHALCSGDALSWLIQRMEDDLKRRA